MEIVVRRNVLCATVKIMASGNLPTKSGKGDWNVVGRKAAEVGFFPVSLRLSQLTRRVRHVPLRRRYAVQCNVLVM